MALLALESTRLHSGGPVTRCRGAGRQAEAQLLEDKPDEDAVESRFGPGPCPPLPPIPHFVFSLQDSC
jgi:hypothetical protein